MSAVKNNQAANEAMVGKSAAMSSTIAVIKKEKEAARGWRQYAGHLRANLEAHKKVEEALLEELKRENVNHPMATVEGFSATFNKMLSDQYGADQLAFDRQEAERMKKAAEEGGRGVSAR